MLQALIITLHGIGTPHAVVAAQESYFWVTQEAYLKLLDCIVAKKDEVPIVITFDDGNMSDVRIALPELLKRGLRAEFFICSGRIGLPHYLDRVAISDLLAAGMEIGTHGKDHRDWRRLDETSLEMEIVEARKRIEDVCRTPVMKAAIPFGSYDRRILKRLSRENFECVYTSDTGLANCITWLRPRETINRTWQEPDMNRVLAAKPTFKQRLRRDAAMLYKSMR